MVTELHTKNRRNDKYNKILFIINCKIYPGRKKKLLGDTYGRNQAL